MLEAPRRPKRMISWAQFIGELGHVNEKASGTSKAVSPDRASSRSGKGD